MDVVREANEVISITISIGFWPTVAFAIAAGFAGAICNEIFWHIRKRGQRC